MTDKHILIFIGLCIIAYFLSVFHRGKLDYAKFILGTISTFFIIFLSLEDICTPLLARLVATTTGIIGNITNTFASYSQYGILFIRNGSETISLYIDYECAGFIEISIFISLIAFFPVFKIPQKLLYGTIGVLCIFLSNVARLTTICLIVYWFGNESFYFAHTIFGRILFYALSVCMYYYIFTKSQIVHQKVGNFNYVKDTNE